ncbi:BsuPI-related putative proteinase inhibitor [Pleionea sp. CnH1-48]|uniref:BsuPI-related putative proteinase inhibitor n=1 Tax=Pleionea sp. CnH1-48 TaxID=2954494 RepID=UPI002097EC25|nr:BsuPI-related putative proteinase inhibitor [Pleionea sp. CnH1-48]MCO7224313.1 BsuPI-related putative proteinase inhibitor [Pleionea sp. CnH1-48]
METLNRSLLGLTCAVFSSVAFSNDYLIHANEDYSKYVGANEQVEESKVVDTYGDNWKQYSSFLGSKNQWVWTDSSNKFYLYNNDSNRAYLFADLDAAVGSTFDIELDACTTKAEIQQRDLTVDTVAGQFNNVVELTFSGPCADAGYSRALFAPTLGLVSYEYITFAGSQEMKLDSAFINGVEYKKTFDQISVSMDYAAKRVFTNTQNMIPAYITLTNKSDSDYVMQFSTTQTFDIELIDDNGVVVNVWSANKRFAQVETNITIKPGQEQKIGGEISMRNINRGDALDLGTYTVRLTLKGGSKPDASVFSVAPITVEFPVHIDSQMVAF